MKIKKFYLLGLILILIFNIFIRGAVVLKVNGENNKSSLIAQDYIKNGLSGANDGKSESNDKTSKNNNKLNLYEGVINNSTEKKTNENLLVNLKNMYNLENKSGITTKNLITTNPWTKSFGGTKGDYFTKLVEVNDGLVVIGESDSNDVDLVGLNKGAYDGIIIKYDYEGNVIWKKTFGGSEYDTFNSIVDVGNGLVVIGRSTSKNGDLAGLNKGNSDSIIVKCDYEGNVIWKKTFGGSNYESFDSIVDTGDGVVVQGTSESNNGDLVGLNKGDSDGIIVKYDYEGNVIWKKTFGGSGTDQIGSIVDIGDGLIAAGFSNSTDGDLTEIGDISGDLFFVRYDYEGNVTWKKTFGESRHDFYRSMIDVSDGLVAVGASYLEDPTEISGTSADACIVKYDYEGNVIWEKTFGENPFDIFYSIADIGDGLVAVGYSGDMYEVRNIEKINAIILKYDYEGNVIWEKTFGGNYHEDFKSVIGVDDGLVAVGFSSSSDRDLSGLNKGSTDGIIIKIKNEDSIIDETIQITPEGSTSSSSNIYISAKSKYGIKNIYDCNKEFIYSNTTSNEVYENGVYKYIIKDNNLSEKIVEVNVNNIDKYKPNKPEIKGENDSLTIEDNGDIGYIYQNDILEGFEDESILSFIPTMDKEWVRSNSIVKNGLYSLKSADLNQNGSTHYQYRVKISEETINPSITFDYKIDSEEYFNLFTFYLDDTKILSDSGTKDWQNFSYDLTPGEHIFSFKYTKNVESTSGTDSVYIDNVNIKCQGNIPVVKSETKELQYSLNDGVTWTKYENPVKLNPGINNIKAKAIDNAGNESEITSKNIIITDPWTKSFGGTKADYFTKLVEVNDGLVVIGESNSNDGDLVGLNKGDSDGIIIKYDYEGSAIWKKTFGGSEYDTFNSIVDVGNGLVVIGRSTSKNGDLAGLNKGDFDGIIVKCDYEGNVIWKKTFGGSNYESFDSIVDTGDGVVVQGTSQSNNGDLVGLNKGEKDGLIVKYDYEGNVIWKKTFGGSGTDEIDSIVDIGDGLIATGYSNSTDGDLTEIGDINVSFFFVRYDYEGNVVWKKTFKGSRYDFYESMIDVSDGLVAVGTSYLENPTEIGGISADACIVKYDYEGNVIWKKTFGENPFDIFYSIADIGDGLVAVGYSGDMYEIRYKEKTNAIIFKYDYEGNVIWEKTFGGNYFEAFNSVIGVDDGLVAVGSSSSADRDLSGLNKGSFEGIIIKIKNEDSILDETIQITPEGSTSSSSNIYISAKSKYGIKNICDFNKEFIYSNTISNEVYENGVYKYTIKDNNLSEKIVEVNVNNIDKYKPNKPEIKGENDSLTIEDNGDISSIYQNDILDGFENESISSFTPTMDKEWVRSNSIFKNGLYSLKSADLNENESTYYQYRVKISEETINPSITFDYKIDSE